MTATFSTLLLFVTVPTNLLVCLAVLIDPNKELRTQFNCFTFNLALADLLAGCVTEAISVYFHIHESLDSEYGHNVDSWMQQVIHTPFLITAVASALSIAALALERYLAITSPFLYRRHFDVKLSVILSIIIWVIALSFGAMNLVLEYMELTFIFVNSVLLLTGIVVSYVCFRIRATLRRASDNWAEIGMHSTREDDLVIQKMLTKTFEMIIGALLCCYLPVCAMVYYMNLCEPCNCDVVQWLRDSLIWLILLNSAVNPFIYAFRSQSYRSAVRIIVRCKCREYRMLRRHLITVSYSRENNKSFKRNEVLPRQVNYGAMSTETEDNTVSNSYQRATIVA